MLFSHACLAVIASTLLGVQAGNERKVTFSKAPGCPGGKENEGFVHDINNEGCLANRGESSVNLGAGGGDYCMRIYERDGATYKPGEHCRGKIIGEKDVKIPQGGEPMCLPLPGYAWQYAFFNGTCADAKKVGQWREPENRFTTGWYGENCNDHKSGFRINVFRRGCLHDRNEMSVPVPYGPDIDQLCIVEHEPAGGPYGENDVCTGCWKAAFPAEQGMCYRPGWRGNPDYRFFKKAKGDSRSCEELVQGTKCK